MSATVPGEWGSYEEMRLRAEKAEADLAQVTAELTKWHALCDAVGTPRDDPEGLVRHHRGNAAAAAAIDTLTAERKYDALVEAMRAVVEKIEDGCDHAPRVGGWCSGCEAIRVELRAALPSTDPPIYLHMETPLPPTTEQPPQDLVRRDVCIDPECTIPTKPGFRRHGPHDFRAGKDT